MNTPWSRCFSFYGPSLCQGIIWTLSDSVHLLFTRCCHENLFLNQILPKTASSRSAAPSEPPWALQDCTIWQVLLFTNRKMHTCFCALHVCQIVVCIHTHIANLCSSSCLAFERGGATRVPSHAGRPARFIFVMMPKGMALSARRLALYTQRISYSYWLTPTTYRSAKSCSM